MSEKNPTVNHDLRRAIEDIQDLIVAAYPDARFETDYDRASGATWVTVRADFDPDAWDDVVDVYIERLLEIQEDRGLWLHFMPVSTRSSTRQIRAA